MIKRWLYLTFLVGVAVTPFFISGGATAAPSGRAANHGYFYNRDYGGGSFVYPHSGANPYWDGTYDVPLWVNTAGRLETFMRTMLNGTTWDHNGAAFTILTMLGYGTPPGGPGIVQPVAGNTYWDKWTLAVNNYDSSGWITWDTPFNYDFNTLCQNSGGPSSTSCDQNDISWFSEPGHSDPHVIVFHDPHFPGKYYAIKRECGNPVGNLDALTLEDWKVNVTASTLGLTQLPDGTRGEVKVDLNNAGTTDSQGGHLQVQRPSASLVMNPCNPGAGTCPPPAPYTMTGLSGSGDSGHRFSSHDGLPPGSTHNGTPDWYWDANNITVSHTSSATFYFEVSPTAPVGSTITFWACYFPQTPSSTDASGDCDHADFTVVSQRTPVVQAIGDVHAGGGLCYANGTFEPGYPPDPDGIVEGMFGSASYSEYVVSGSSTITDFGTNGATSGSARDLLQVGQGGGYSQVCREDLYQNFINYKNANAAGPLTWQPLAAGPASPIDVGKALFDTGPQAYFVNGDAYVSGNFKDKITLIVSGNVYITGDIKDIAGAGPSPRTIPSLGIIADGDIDIAPAATQVDAYLFSDGNIDTCNGAGSCATAALQVNGFLMGNRIYLKRLGPFNANGSPAAEIVTLTPQIYLNPPRFFDSSVDQNPLQGQGEEPPLF